MIPKVLRDAAQMRMRRRTVAMLLVFQLLGTLMELLSLAILLPVFQFVQAGGNAAALAAEYRHWRWLTDVYAVFGLPPSLATLLATSFAFLLLRQAFTYVRLLAQARARQFMMERMRNEAFESYLHADAAYHDLGESSELINDITTDLQRAADYVFGEIMLTALIMVVSVYVACLLILSVPMTLTAMVVFGVALLMLQSQMRKSEVSGNEVINANRGMSAFLIERMRLARHVRLAGMERAETEHMLKLSARQSAGILRLYQLLARVDVIIEPLVIGAAYGLIFVSITMFGLKIEQIGLFLVIVVRLLPVVKEIARTRQANRSSRPAYRSINARLEEMVAARERGGGTRTFAKLSSSLKFEGVRFSYEKAGGRPALADVTAEFTAGQLTALVGPSGAGKSTLVDLIPRLRHPDAGAISLDGIGIDDFALESLRAGIAYAPQTPQIFNVPIIEHIRYGKTDATIAEAHRACELANAAGFIERLPEGYQTLCGEGGTRLSGGQRQRVDLARALVRQAPILLLDEPTSNLDADSEALFRDALIRIRRETGITVIVIAHRLSTVAMADKIIVLQAGCVVAQGSHSALIAADGWYASAFRKQGWGLREEAAQ